jgi:hypothetical protein
MVGVGGVSHWGGRRYLGEWEVVAAFFIKKAVTNLFRMVAQPFRLLIERLTGPKIKN